MKALLCSAKRAASHDAAATSEASHARIVSASLKMVQTLHYKGKRVITYPALARQSCLLAFALP